MRRFYIPSLLVIATFILASGYPLVSAPDLVPCRGGVLYGTVWVRAAVNPFTGFGYAADDARSAGWGGGQVSIHIIQRGRVLASTRTDSQGRYRFCGLPVRSSFDLVAVPADPSYGVHSELMTITLAGGQQRNIYPARRLGPMPAVLDGRYVAPSNSGRPAYATVPDHALAPGYAASSVTSNAGGTRTSGSLTIAETRQGTATVYGDPDPNAPGRIRWRDETEPATDYRRDYAADRSVSAYGLVEPPTRSPYDRVDPQLTLDERRTDLVWKQREADYQARVTESMEPLRVLSADGLMMYFTDGTPRYMQLSVPGLDGRGCYFEFDLGLDAQMVESTKWGHDLVSPSWGRIHVERPRADRLTIDLSGVYTPVCRSRGADGGPLVWMLGPGGWVRAPNV